MRITDSPSTVRPGLVLLVTSAAAFVAGLDLFIVVAAVVVFLRLFNVSPWTPWILDMHTYWATGAGVSYVHSNPYVIGAYLYAPVFAQAIAPLTLLPWPWFAALSTGVLGTLCFAPFEQSWICWIALTPLLDATGAYHRDIARQMEASHVHFTTPMMHHSRYFSGAFVHRSIALW